MITEIFTLEKVLENIQPFNTKEDIVHEIETMLHEAEEQLNKDTIASLEENLQSDFFTEEEKEEIRQDLKMMKQELGTEP